MTGSVKVLSRDAEGQQWGTVNALAERFGIRPTTIYSWARRPTVRTKRHNGRVLINLLDIAHIEKAWRERDRGHARTWHEPEGGT